MTEKLKNSLAKIASLMGRKGGKSGKGKSKVRGNASYYRDMQRKSVVSRLAARELSVTKEKGN